MLIKYNKVQFLEILSVCLKNLPKTIDKDNGNDVFEIISEGDLIVISASSPVAMCSGFNWYLKHVANCHVSWNGDQLNLSDPLPPVDKRIRKGSPDKYGYYFT